MHMILCMSPVGEALRVRARKFPGLVNSTMIDWFHPWPLKALNDVAYNFLKEVEFPMESLNQTISLYMSETHIQIEVTNQNFFIQERRYNYTTPKSFLELIDFYKN